MRFLMLNWRDPKNPKSGGAERVSVAYLKALVERGHEAAWFTHGFDGGAAEETIDGIQVVRSGGTISSIRAAKKWVRQQARFDLVIDQHHGIPWYAPWWCGTNCVAYLHEILGPIWNAFYGWPWNIIGRTQEKWTYRFYGNVPFFTGSGITKDLLHERGVKDVSVVRYGTDVKVLPELPPKELKPPYHFIVVSRLAPNKQIDHAIRAIKVLRNKQHACSLTVVGGGEEEWSLKELARGIGVGDFVDFTGQLSEEKKNEQMQKAHFILHTSQREGWGLNVTEANAMGTPGAVYPVGGLIESTLNDRTGIVSKKETPESLAERLMGAFERPDDYDQWRKAAWEFAQDLHWDNVLPKACDWFEEQAKR
ncbi:MAG: glycosyl transferase group 1 [Verrucomicrobiales bacterium]|nr:glycosyl transferase group 1 [Verrucomicrobiales bacterium]|tara:strand:- start:3755 stop:4849 length:1095 start_codon:yes stop_codon:yes gene_type:complete